MWLVNYLENMVLVIYNSRWVRYASEDYIGR